MLGRTKAFDLSDRGACLSSLWTFMFDPIFYHSQSSMIICCIAISLINRRVYVASVVCVASVSEREIAG